MCRLHWPTIAWLSIQCSLNTSCVTAVPLEDTSPASFNEIQQSCGFEEEPLLLPNGTVQLSKTCATALASLVGLKWSSFQDEAHAVESPASVIDSVVGGLYLLIGPGGGTIEEALVQEAPMEFSKALMDIMEEPSGPTPDDDIGRLWYELLNRHVDTLKYDSSIDSIAAYQNNTIFIGADSGLIEPDGTSILDEEFHSFFRSAVTLAHETSHFLYNKEHVVCIDTGEPDCDDNSDGAYGVGSWWGYQWVERNHTLLNYDVCFDGVQAVYYSCEAINNDTGWEFCDLDALFDKCLVNQNP